MNAEQIIDRVMVTLAMLIGLAMGAQIGDVSDALLAGVCGIALSEAYDLVRRWGRDAWPVIKDWWMR